MSILHCAVTLLSNLKLVHLYDMEIQGIMPLRITVFDDITRRPVEATFDYCSTKRDNLYYFSQKKEVEHEECTDSVPAGCRVCGSKQTEETTSPGITGSDQSIPPSH